MAYPQLVLKNQFGEESINYVLSEDFIELASNVRIFSGATAPINGTTGDNVAGKGSLYVALDTGVLYQQTGAITNPTWVAVGDNEVAIDQLLTGFSSGAGVVASTDTILEGINKLDGNQIAAAVATVVTGKLLTNFSAGAGVVAATDSILQAINKLAGNNGSRVQRVTVGYADLNTAGTGVALALGTAIPDKAIIKRVYYDVKTTFADNGTAGDADDSTISFGLNTNVDVLAAVAISDGTPFDAGIHEGLQVGTAATMTKLTAARQLKAVWTLAGDVTALTAGALDVFIEYDLGL